MIKTYTRSVKQIDMINRRHAFKVDDNHYRVYGRDADSYILFVYWDSKGNAHILCPCHAGAHNNPCFHASVVYRRLKREKLIG